MVRTSTGQVRINFHIPADTLAVLKRMAANRGTTYSELIRLACRDYALKHAAQFAQDDRALREASQP